MRGGKGKGQAPHGTKAPTQRSHTTGGRGGNQRSGRQGDRRTGDERTQGRRQGGQSSQGWIEGRRAVAEALEVGMPLRRALVADGDGSLASLVRELEEAGVPVERASRSRLDAISSHGAHQGIAVQIAPFRYADLEDVLARAGEGDALVVLLDHVTDQGNLGAIIRSAEVVGAAGVIIAKARAAGVGVGAYKTSAGAVLHIPIAQVSNLSTAIEVLKKHGFWVGGATEHAHDDVWSAPMGGRLCLVMGSEGDGISRLVRERCDFECKLPQRGRVESLNVAQAATVMCYEWLRRVSMEQSQMSAKPSKRVTDKPANKASRLLDVKPPADDDVLLMDATGSDEGSSTPDASFMVDAAAGYDIDWDL